MSRDKQLHIRLTEEQKRRLRIIAANNNIGSMSKAVGIIVDHEFNRHSVTDQPLTTAYEVEQQQH